MRFATHLKLYILKSLYYEKTIEKMKYVVNELKNAIEYFNAN